jgi:predicted O-methyltransferase YrrM
MAKKDALKNLIIRGARLFANEAERDWRDSRNVDLVLSAALEEAHALSTIQYPLAYVEFLRTCIEPITHTVTEIKVDASPPDVAAKRFSTLMDQLRSGLPAIEFAVAQQIAVAADHFRTLSDRVDMANWAGDTGLHFSIASSFGSKGRILFNTIRFMRSENCLELGTAYGMSALFILGALQRGANRGHLTTVEGWEHLYSLSSPLLKRLYGESVSCHLGRTESVLPELVKSLGRIDFMFHDCGHSAEDYVRDFGQVIEALAPGAVVLFDDIRWEDPRFSSGTSRTYEGWKEVTGHPRIKQAVEIDGLLGLLLLG